MKKDTFDVIGCMSGTSADGIDLALLETDGRRHNKPLGFMSFPYSPDQRKVIKAAFGLSDMNDPRVKAAEDIITTTHIEALRKTGWQAELIGFHGQTIFHDPARKITRQIGDGARVAKALSIPVIYDFRSNDVMSGGQGAPLLPLYHRARLSRHDAPAVILNIGGVANVTWIYGNDILAFDTGPGNALIDDYCAAHLSRHFDEDGEIAAQGHVNEDLLSQWMNNLYFAARPPKSLDRDAFVNCSVSDISYENALATLTAFTARSIAAATDHFPAPAQHWYVSGGGRHNHTMMTMLEQALGHNIQTVQDLGWNGDALEAEGFAFLAMRAKLGLPLSLPTTTGCAEPMSGGKTALP